jgi:hypothetical protein
MKKYKVVGSVMVTLAIMLVITFLEKQYSDRLIVNESMLRISENLYG